MFIDDDENLYLPVKNSHVVLKYDPSGNLLMTMGEWDQPSDTGWSGNYSDPAVRAAGPFNRPSDIAISPDGLLYISDGYGNARVHRFTPDGELIDSWGAPGKTAPGEFHVPHGVWVHTDGRVFVADRENNRMQIFDSEGNFLEQWPNLARPCDIYIDNDLAVYVPELDGFMSILDIQGNVLASWGSPSDAGWGQRRPRRLGRFPRRHLREPEPRRRAADQVPPRRSLGPVDKSGLSSPALRHCGPPQTGIIWRWMFQSSGRSGRMAASDNSDGATTEAATVSAMLDEHARLGALLRDAIAATPAPDDDYWVGMSVDEIVVRGKSPEAVMAAIDGRGMAGGTVVLEFVSAEPQVIVL